MQSINIANLETKRHPILLVIEHQPDVSTPIFIKQPQTQQ